MVNPNDPRYHQAGPGHPGQPGQPGGFEGSPPGFQPPPQQMAPVPLPEPPRSIPIGLILLKLTLMALKWAAVIMAVLLAVFFVFKFFGFATGAIAGFFEAVMTMLSGFYDSIAGSRIGIGRNGDGILALGMILIAVIGIVKLLRK